MPNDELKKELEQSYKEAEGLADGVIPDWMLERARLEEQGVDFGDGMCSGMTPPATRIPNA